MIFCYMSEVLVDTLAGRVVRLPVLTDGMGTPDPNPRHGVNWCL